MLIKTISHTLNKCARSLMTFIIIILIFWHINSWAASINYLNMQLTSASLLNIVLILIFSIITLTIEQTTTYMKRKKATRITIFFKYIDFVELSLIKSIYTFFFYVFWLCNDFSFFDIVFIFSSMMLRNICLNNSKEILSNSRKRISINMFNICLITSTEFDYFLILYINFLSLFVILTTSTELNLINFIFLYLIIYESELMSTKIFFIATFARRTSINFEFLLKTILFVRFTAFE